MKIRILSASEVRQALPMAEAIAGVRQAFIQLAAGQADMPLRTGVSVTAASEKIAGTVLVMPAHLRQSQALAVKVVSVFPGNPAVALPLVQGVVLVLEAETGQPLALLEGGAVTAIRTGAASGVATDLLARPDATVAAIIGTGVQARTQLEAICTVRTIQEVRVYGRTAAHADLLVAEMAGSGPVPRQIIAVSSVKAAVTDADIICTATASSSPVFSGEWLKPGAHVNGIGSYTPEMQEVDSETILRSLVIVDSKTAALAEAGDLIIPLQQGLITEAHIHAELGEILLGAKHGRTSPDQITYFKSVGVAVQDITAAHIAYLNALARNLGVMVML